MWKIIQNLPEGAGRVFKVVPELPETGIPLFPGIDPRVPEYDRDTETQFIKASPDSLIKFQS